MTRQSYAGFRRIPVLLVAAMLTASNPGFAADRTLGVSGDSVPSDCGAAKKANSASMLSGSLEGCLAIFIQHSNCRAMTGFDLYNELGREEFEGKLEGQAIKFDTQYTFDGIWPAGSCPNAAPEKEVAGACTHYISGEGVQGLIRFYDIIPTVGKGASNFFYEGNITLSDVPSAAIAPVVPGAFAVAAADPVLPPGLPGQQSLSC